MPPLGVAITPTYARSPPRDRASLRWNSRKLSPKKIRQIDAPKSSKILCVSASPFVFSRDRYRYVARRLFVLRSYNFTKTIAVSLQTVKNIFPHISTSHNDNRLSLPRQRQLPLTLYEIEWQTPRRGKSRGTPNPSDANGAAPGIVSANRA